MIKYRLKKEKTASFDVDAQNGFTPVCPDELPVPEGDQIVKELNKQSQIAKFRVGSKEVHPPNAIHVADEKHPQLTPIENGGKDVDFYWNRHCVSGTKGSQLLEGLPKIKEYDYFVFKGIEPELHPYSACYHDMEKKLTTGVIEWLKFRGVDTIVVGGLAFDFCVLETVKDLTNHFKVYVNKAATRSIGNFNEVMMKMSELGVSFVDNSTFLIN